MRKNERKSIGRRKNATYEECMQWLVDNSLVLWIDTEEKMRAALSIYIQTDPAGGGGTPDREGE